jgi:hemerythrin-like metal-binding protein
MATQDHYPVNKQFTAMSHDIPPLPSGDKLICDSRYRNIINRLNAMIELISTKPGTDLTVEADQLLDAMTDHIDSENSVMAMVGYLNTVHHRMHHQFICHHTAELRHRFSTCREVLPEELTYVRQLWLAHIQMYDRAFKEFLAC